MSELTLPTSADGEQVLFNPFEPGFFDNPRLGLPSLNGLMILFSSRTGQVQALLLDNGYLTDVRTAAAGEGGSVSTTAAPASKPRAPASPPPSAISPTLRSRRLSRA